MAALWPGSAACQGAIPGAPATARGVSQLLTWACLGVCRCRESEIERIARVAFEAAMKRGKQLCSVEKSNVLEVGGGWGSWAGAGRALRSCPKPGPRFMSWGLTIWGTPADQP